MRIKLLDNITGKWAKQWFVIWFIFGVTALGTGFWKTTDHSPLDWFYLSVSLVGLVCVVSLSFRKAIMGNSLGMLATAGESVVQATSGAVGLMMAPMFNFFTHVYGLIYWSKNTDADGNMVPKSATKAVWFITLTFIAIGLLLFPTVNNILAAQGYTTLFEEDNRKLFGVINFYWLNVFAFVLGITAQVTMILRYSFNWWIWILSNFVWLTINLMTGNYIFAIQTMVYQINACIGLYEWQRHERDIIVNPA